MLSPPDLRFAQPQKVRIELIADQSTCYSDFTTSQQQPKKQKLAKQINVIFFFNSDSTYK